MDLENAYRYLPALLDVYAREPFRIGVAVARFLVDFLNGREAAQAVEKLLTKAHGRWPLLLEALHSADISLRQVGDPHGEHEEFALDVRFRPSVSREITNGVSLPPDTEAADLEALQQALDVSMVSFGHQVGVFDA